MTLVAGNPVVSGTAISTTVQNATMADLAAEIEDSLSRSGKGGMLVPFLNSDGNLGSPGISFTSETTSGWFRNAAGDIRAAVLGVLRLTLNTVGALINGTLTVSGATTLSSTLAVTGNANIGGNLSVTGTMSFTTPTWAAPTFSAGWSTTAPNAGGIGTYKDPLGFVHLSGSTQKGGGSGGSVCTLPVGNRPLFERQFITRYLDVAGPPALGDYAIITISAAGLVSVDPGVVSGVLITTGDILYLDGITFLGEQ